MFELLMVLGIYISGCVFSASILRLYRTKNEIDYTYRLQGMKYYIVFAWPLALVLLIIVGGSLYLVDKIIGDE